MSDSIQAALDGMDVATTWIHSLITHGMRIGMTSETTVPDSLGRRQHVETAWRPPTIAPADCTISHMIDATSVATAPEPEPHKGGTCWHSARRGI